MLIDSHCHLAKAENEGRLDEWLTRMRENGVGACIAVGTSHDDWELYFHLAKAHPGVVYWTVGLHPCSVEDDWREQVTAISTYFTVDPLPVALGEIGLDYFHLPKFPDEAAEVKSRQRAAFRAQLELAFQFDCPVIIHSRNAFADCVEEIDRSGISWSRVVFHCFVEGPDEMEILRQRGGFGSFTGILTYKAKTADSVREAALAQGLDALMVETDSPYLTPEPHRGKPNQPAFVRHVAEKAAALFDVPFETIVSKTRARTIDFFGLDLK